MAMYLVLLLLFLAEFSKVSPDSTEHPMLPSYVHVCYRDDPDNSLCMKESIQELLPYIKDGNKDFELEPVDPLTFKSLVFKYNSPLLGGNISVSDAVVTGLSNITILDVRPDLTDSKKFEIVFDTFAPLLNVKANYKMVGNVIQIATKMRGRVHMDLENVTLTYHIEGDIEEKNGREYITLRKFAWRMNGDGIRHLKILNNDVVQGRPALNRIVRTVMKSSWRLLRDNMLPRLLPETDKLLTKMFLKFFNKYPYDVLLPKLYDSEDVTATTTEADES